MNTNRRFSQTSPDKANDLFAKLLDTSDTAIKTRERLFTSLKEELELLANLQEQYLFPVLRKHEDMAGLVQAATNDNRETSALLEELDRMPKGSGDFLKKIAELRKVFQQHIRDDKKELLPAVLKVLSEDEVEAVVEKVEDEMAAVEEARRAESGLRREIVSYSRDLVGVPERVQENMAAAIRTGVERSQETLHNVQDAVQTGLNVSTEFAQLYSVPLSTGQEFAGRASRNLHALAQSNTILARGMQDVSQEWIGLAQERLQKNIEGLSALSHCRTLAELLEAQGAIFRDNLTQMLENGRRIVELSSRIANEASHTWAAQQETGSQRDNRAA